MKSDAGTTRPHNSQQPANEAAPFGQAGSPNVLSESTNQGSGPGFVEFSIEEAGKAVAVLEDEGGKTTD